MAVRQATHAGSWYSDQADELTSQLESLLAIARPGLVQGMTPKKNLKALIGPHAGYSYSGKTAAFGYVDVDPDAVETVFLLGPSHHVYLEGCALSKASVYRTPVGDITVDVDLCNELAGSGKFKRMSIDVDQDEHSLEMHLPYIRHVMGGKAFKLVPIMVGYLDAKLEKAYGELLAPFFDRPGTIFIISSDFCHWGRRFRFTYWDKCVPIWKSIEDLDKQGMNMIEQKNADGFRAYLSEFGNTICGRFPIQIFLQVVAHSTQSAEVKFVHYAQSSQCMNMSDSSVSYATAVCVVPS